MMEKMTERARILDGMKEELDTELEISKTEESRKDSMETAPIRS